MWKNHPHLWQDFNKYNKVGQILIEIGEKLIFLKISNKILQIFHKIIYENHHQF